MGIGNLIKHQRIEKGFTQEELCLGICSVSYLSKIEHSVTIPSREIINLLLSRLGIQEYDNHEDSNLESRRKMIINIYKGLIEKKNFVEEDNILEIFESKLYIGDNWVLRDLVLVRYNINKRELEKAEIILSKLSDIIDNCIEQEKFIFFKNRGLLNYLNSNFTKALIDYNQSKSFITNLNILDWDIADLYFQLALTNGKLQKVQNSIEFASKAIEYFDKDYNFLKSADCQILLGISYQRLENYDAAMKSYDLALRIAKTFNDTTLMSSIYHNLGYLNSLRDNYMIAVKYFNKSIEIRCGNDKVIKKNINSILNTIHSMIQLHYKEGNVIEVKRFLDMGEEMLEHYNNYPNLEYKYHFNTYSKLIHNAIDKNHYIESEVLPYFKKKENSRYIYKYSKILAQVYEIDRKYKKVSIFIRLQSKLYRL
ncbi:helix-turn-helix transcriptional regulator [Mangrovibacillus cuniculi]|uniref:Helix-turn-helix transcriptional regulator n=1 Tax=Mangrovibacillus cuniculi TaxID=2593652 RepID=A0A7S8CE02_9BACI|nr:helix-turn-helix transcriptional regulator [Mangrovibacillus cuniculi]QPC48226.1 helix-turn-helix transcriptional regulator [Mangrovibacillus cuniculi]